MCLTDRFLLREVAAALTLGVGGTIKETATPHFCLKLLEIFRMTTISIENFKIAAANELIQIVDNNNVPVKVVARAQMRAEKLIHRATYAFIFNSANKLYVQKRSKHKDYW